MSFGITGFNKASLTFGLLLVLTACNDSNNNSAQGEPEAPIEPSITYSADITWTEYGVPHITAADFGSAGYGNGYAFANLNFCGLMREVTLSR